MYSKITRIVFSIRLVATKLINNQDMGTTLNHNLFHSFKSFDINTGEAVIFQGGNHLKNVISRVTGGEVSRINGTLISSIKNANFYFINPAGIFFGGGAKIDVPATFHVSTVNYNEEQGNGLMFPDATKDSSLTIAQQNDFLNNLSGDIRVDHVDLNLEHQNELSLTSRHDVVIDSGSINNYHSNVTILAKELLINTNNQPINNGNCYNRIIYPNNEPILTISFTSSGGVGIGVGTDYAGNIRINASSLTLSDYADVVSTTLVEGNESNSARIMINKKSLIKHNSLAVNFTYKTDKVNNINDNGDSLIFEGVKIQTE
ncbi:MAG: filamentous hemagglutinin N-terminal domain-containing protein [Methylococcaceae bacterium]